MTPPSDDNKEVKDFRYDSEFIQIIRKQTEHDLLLNQLKSDFQVQCHNINTKLDKIPEQVSESRKTCRNYRPTNQAKDGFDLSMDYKTAVKVFVILVVAVLILYTGADEVILVDTLSEYQVKNTKIGEYHISKMHNRNQFMVNQSKFVIAVWDGSSGGTSNCVNYAKKKKRDIVIIGLDGSITRIESNSNQD